MQKRNWKGLWALILGLVLLFAAGCGESSSASQPAAQAAKAVNQQSAGSHILIAYYSHTGTTRAAAEKIHQLVGGDLVELQPEKPYPADHQEHLQMVIKEIESNARPKLKTKLDHMEQYDTVFVGYPIWDYQAPLMMNTFLESYDLSGKKVVPFCTSGGYPIEKSVGILEASAKGAQVTEGLRYSGSEQELRDWLAKVGVPLKK